MAQKPFIIRHGLNTGSTEIINSNASINTSSIDFSGVSTDDISEGNNLYFTDSRTRAAVSSSGDLTYNSSTGQFSIDVMTIVKAEDGSGSLLDADFLDGQQGTYYLDYNNFINTPTIPTNNNQLTNGAGYITGETTTTLTSDSINQKLVFTDETGTVNDIDLSWAVDDANLARLTSGTIDDETGIATFTRDDATSFTVDFSSLFDDTNLTRITSAGFNTSDGILTLTRSDATTVTVDLDGRYLQSFTEVNNLTSNVTWANVPNANITQSSVTQHQAALSITQSQISDLSVSINDLTDGYVNDSSIGLGAGALANDNGTNNINVALGIEALTSNNSGTGNVAVGNYTLFSNTSGGGNVAVGYQALLYNITANGNVAVGYQALEDCTSSSNNAVGYWALRNITTGFQNCGFGTLAGDSLTTGDDNTLLGFYAGGTVLTTGNNNTIIGAEAEPSSGSVSNEITLGNASITRFRIPGIDLDTNNAADGEVLQWNTTNGGFVWTSLPTNTSDLTNDSGFTTNVGDITRVIAGTGLSGGGITGSVTLNVALSDLPGLVATMSGTDEFAVIYNGNTTAKKSADEIGLSIFNNDAGFITSADGGNAATLDSLDFTQFLRSDATDSKTSGNLDFNDNIKLRFGTSGGESELYSNGSHTYWELNGNKDLYITDEGTNRFLFDGSVGDFHADGDIIGFSTSVSDERLKENIQVMKGALSKVEQINGVTFSFKHNGKKSAGVIAQQIQSILPEAVSERPLPLITESTEDLYKTVEYDMLHALLIEAVKELSAEVKELKKKIGE